MLSNYNYNCNVPIEFKSIIVLYNSRTIIHKLLSLDGQDHFGSAFLDASVETKLPPPALKKVSLDGPESRFIPEVREIRASPVVSRKGYLKVGSSQDEEWTKKWIVCSSQYL